MGSIPPPPPLHYDPLYYPGSRLAVFSCQFVSGFDFWEAGVTPFNRRPLFAFRIVECPVFILEGNDCFDDFNDHWTFSLW